MERPVGVLGGDVLFGSFGVVADEEVALDCEAEEGVAVGSWEVDELDTDLGFAGQDGALAGPSDGGLDGELVAGVFVGEGVGFGVAD